MQALWPTARDAFAAGEIDWVNDDFLFVALDSTYTYDPSHEFRDDLSGVLATTDLLSTAITGNGACDAADVLLPAPAALTVIRSIVICTKTGNAATDRNIYFADTGADGVAISRTSDGVNDIGFVWSNGPNRIFRI
jgi:hypothetical protein